MSQHLHAQAQNPPPLHTHTQAHMTGLRRSCRRFIDKLMAKSFFWVAMSYIFHVLASFQNDFAIFQNVFAIIYMTLPHTHMTLPPQWWQGHFSVWQIHFFGVLGPFFSHDRFRAKVWPNRK